MSVSLVDRAASRAASPRKLRDRCVYIENEAAPSHAKKTVLRARNHNCPGSTSEHFVIEVLRIHEEYLKWRARKRGKRSPRLFEELTYSTPHHALPKAEERARIERKLLDAFGKHTACRLGWHIDKDTGRADLHILLAAKTFGWPPELTLWVECGGGKKHFYAALDQLDEEITNEILNRGRAREQRFKSAPQIHREKKFNAIGKKPDLANELSMLDFAPGNLAGAITKLGYVVTKITTTNISVLFPGRKRPNRYNIAELLRKIAKAGHGHGNKKTVRKSKPLEPPKL
jgi:hypothetical protein